mgnify:CR=1 FL=1
MLFIENSYLKDFETKIKKIENNNIILEQTAFYAKSGGQPGDMGKIIFNENEIDIVDTIYDHEKNILHVCENTDGLQVGEKINGKINWNIRYKIRLVKIGNIDLQPCGGTHVKSTKEIGEIKIGKIENKGKMNRRVNLSIND